MTPDRRLVAVPDPEGELLAVLGVLEEILLSLVPHPNDPKEWDPPDSPLGDGTALAAIQNVAAAVANAERSPAPQLITPDGGFELVTLRFVEVDGADIAVIAQALAALDRATLPAGDEFVGDSLRGYGRTDPSNFVTSAFRVHALLDLTPNNDTRTLADRLGAAAGRVVLEPSEYAAYERLTERVLRTFHKGDPLARFVYRGMSGWSEALDQPHEPDEQRQRSPRDFGLDL